MRLQGFRAAIGYQKPTSRASISLAQFTCTRSPCVLAFLVSILLATPTFRRPASNCIYTQPSIDVITARQDGQCRMVYRAAVSIHPCKTFCANIVAVRLRTSMKCAMLATRPKRRPRTTTRATRSLRKTNILRKTKIVPKKCTCGHYHNLFIIAMWC